MKKIIFIIVCLFWSVLCFISCKKTGKIKLEEQSISVLDVIANVQDDHIWKEIIICEEFDNELEFVLNVKAAVDKTRLKLVKNESLSEELNNSEECIKYLYNLMGIVVSLDESQNIFKNHIQFLLSFLSQKKDDTTLYLKCKQDLLAKDNDFKEAATLVLQKMSEYTEAKKKFEAFLTEVLEKVKEEDLESAIALLKSDDITMFKRASAELMNALYLFECSRSKSMLEVYNMIY